jgi:hypothetical protein
MMGLLKLPPNFEGKDLFKNCDAKNDVEIVVTQVWWHKVATHFLVHHLQHLGHLDC